MPQDIKNRLSRPVMKHSVSLLNVYKCDSFREDLANLLVHETLRRTVLKKVCVLRCLGEYDCK